MIKLFIKINIMVVFVVFFFLCLSSVKMYAYHNTKIPPDNYWDSVYIRPIEARDRSFFDINHHYSTITNLNMIEPIGMSHVNNYENSVIIEGLGTGFASHNDSFKYTYIPIVNDCTITAKIRYLNAMDTNHASAGIMIRENLSSGSKYAFLSAMSDNRTGLLFRENDNEHTLSNLFIENNSSVHVKLERTGDNFSAYISHDGENWSQFCSPVTINMSSEIYVGFAVSGNSTSVIFEHVSINYIDNTPPSVPGNVRVLETCLNKYTLMWDTSSDNAGVVLYEIYHNGNIIGTSKTNSFEATSVPLGHIHKFNVLAVDAAGNKSVPSEDVLFLGRKEIKSTDIKNIRLNKIGFERINQTRLLQGKSPILSYNFSPFGQEIITDNTPNNIYVEKMIVDLNTILKESLPTNVDNSTLPYFPGISTQLFDDCGAFSSTYYTMTHMYNAKNNQSEYFSPKFTYSLSGATYSKANPFHFILIENGCATLSQVPYIDDNKNGFSLPVNQEAWTSAINYRMDKCGYIDINELLGLYKLKQLLNNGYLLNIITPIFSFDEKNALHINNNQNLPKAYYMIEGNEGSHYMTIVGYDDDAWVDINGDGIIQDNEKGAFKIANSWGTEYDYDGFIYLAYDAVYNVSSFPHLGLVSSRTPAFLEGLVWWITPRDNYNPKLIGEITLNHSSRNQLKVAIGYSDIDQTVPKAYFQPVGLNYLSSSVSFDYTDTACDGNFAIDFTDLITEFNLNPFKKYRWYVKIGDTLADGLPAILKDYRLFNTISSAYTKYHGPNITADGNSSMIYIDYSLARYGDVTGNGIVGSKDYVLIRDYVSGKISEFPSPYGLLAADVDGDGEITINDVILVREMIQDRINKFPVELK
ncbi:UNVERIFIED_CONTAM: hypothetical protein Cloal_3085 [Acetivibrio alkalicellulosi]